MTTKNKKASDFIKPDRSQKNIIIPEGVEEIDFNLFNEDENLESVSFPSTLKVIGSWAFSGCTNLREVIIPNGVEAINVEAFSFCSNLRKVTLPRTLKKIEDGAFSFCYSLEKITIPGSVKKLDIATFSDSSLREVVIEDGVKFIDALAFLGCKKLERISLSKTIKIIATNAFERCSSIKEVTVPINVFFNTRLYEIEPFNNQNIKFNITYDNITEFNYYYLNNPEVIKDYQLRGIISFTNLSEINHGTIKYEESISPIKTIEKENLEAPYLSSTSFEIPEGIEIINESTFKNINNKKNIKRIILPSTLEDIESRAFEGFSSLEEVIIPEGILFLDDKFFDKCENFKRLVYSNMLEELENNNVLCREDLGDNPSSLTSFEIPEGIVAIEHDTFKDCKNLKTVTMPSTLKAISYRAFAGCTALEKITLNEGLKVIGNNAFYGCVSLKEVILPNTIKSVGVEAFKDCPNLRNVVLPEGLQEIYAFHFNKGITNITIPSSLKTVPKYFMYCASNLKEVTINEGIEKISKHAFAQCFKLKEVHLPSTLKTIEDEAFFDCAKLEEIELPEGLESIGGEVFLACTNLTNIKLPSTLKELGPKAFHSCSSLKKLNLPINLKLAATSLSSIEFLEEVRVEYTNLNELYDFVSRNKVELNEYYTNRGPEKMIFAGPKLNILDTIKLGLLLNPKAYTLIEEEKKEIPVEETPPTIPEKVIPFVTGDKEIDTIINNIHKLSFNLSIETQQKIEDQITRIINKYNEAKKEFEPKLEDSLNKIELHFGTPETVRLNTISELENILINLNDIEKYNTSFEKLDYYRQLVNGQKKAKDDNDFIADDIRHIIITLEKFPKEYKSKKQQELLAIIDAIENKIKNNIDTLFDDIFFTNPEEVDYRSELAINIGKIFEQLTKDHNYLMKYLTLLNTLKIRDDKPRTGEYPAKDLSELRRIITLLPFSQFRDDLKKEYIEFTDECIQDVLNTIKSNECYTLTKYDEIIRKIRSKIIVLCTKINNREQEDLLNKINEKIEEIEPVSIHSQRDLLDQLEICKEIILTRRAVEPLTMLNTTVVKKKILEFYNNVITSTYLTTEYKERLILYLISTIEQQKQLTSNSNASIYNNFFLDYLFNSISKLEMILFNYEIEKREYDKGFKTNQ